jgi:small neutral amino acid transporter SnatA (MarC family)
MAIAKMPMILGPKTLASTIAASNEKPDSITLLPKELNKALRTLACI